MGELETWAAKLLEGIDERFGRLGEVDLGSRIQEARDELRRLLEPAAAPGETETPAEAPATSSTSAETETPAATSAAAETEAPTA